MSLNKNEMIEQLKFEIEMIEKGRYYPSVRTPRQQPEIFRDTITCMNVGLTEKKYPCSSCFLSAFVSPQGRDDHGEICHKIPLNEKGDTIHSRPLTIHTSSRKPSWAGLKIPSQNSSGELTASSRGE